MRRRLAWVWFASVLASACAQIDGGADGLDSVGSPSGLDDAGATQGGSDANASTGGSTGGQDGTQGDATTGGDVDVDGGSDSGSGSTGNGGGATSGGSSGGTTGAATSGDGSCAAPFELGLTGSRGSHSGTTVGKAETLSPKCSPNTLTDTGVPGPDQVYRLRAPYAAEVKVAATSSDFQFAPSVYVTTSCGNSASETACDYQGQLSFNATSGADYYVYVDSGATDNWLLGMLTNPAGPYSLSVTLRELVGEGEACGDAATSAKCNVGTLSCRDEGGASRVCRAISCGDGFVEGSETCDDMNGDPADGCDACKLAETCASPSPLAFTTQGTQQVATLSSTTAAATKDIDLSCSGSGGPDQMFSFTLGVSSRVSIELDSDFDGQLGLLRGTCAVASELDCADAVAAGAVETYDGTLAAGTYFVVVQGYDGAKGNYSLTVTIAP